MDHHHQSRQISAILYVNGSGAKNLRRPEYIGKMGRHLNMKAKEREKQITQHMPKRDLVDDAVARLKAVKQISNDYTIPYEQVCSLLADCRLQIFRDEGCGVDAYSQEYLYLLHMVIEMQYLFGSSNVEKEHKDFMEYYKGLSVEQKQKVDAGLVSKHRFLDYHLPVFGIDKTQEIFWMGRYMGFDEGCTVTRFMNNYRYFDSCIDKYKLKCLLCDKDGLYYRLMCRSRIEEEDMTEDFCEGFIYFLCRDHYAPLQKPEEVSERIVRKLDQIKR